MLRRFLIILVLAASPCGAFAAEVSDDAHGGPTEGKGSYVKFDGLTVTIFRNDLPAGQLSTRLVVEVGSAEARNTVSASRVKLRDAFLRELHRIVEREARNGPKVDLDLIKVRMRKVAQRQLGSEVVSDVLVQALLRRGG